MIPSRRTELAAAARRVAALARQIPEDHRPDVAGEWGKLMDSIEDLSDIEAVAEIRVWLEAFEARLRVSFAAAPLDRSRA